MNEAMSEGRETSGKRYREKERGKRKQRKARREGRVDREKSENRRLVRYPHEGSGDS